MQRADDRTAEWQRRVIEQDRVKPANPVSFEGASSTDDAKNRNPCRETGCDETADENASLHVPQHERLTKEPPSATQGADQSSTSGVATKCSINSVFWASVARNSQHNSQHDGPLVGSSGRAAR